MLINSGLTVYHKDIDKTTKLEKWTKYNYNNVWFFGGKGAGIRKGYQDANDVEIRIPYDVNPDLDITKFNIGDIIVQGVLNETISGQKDLNDYITYNVTSINDNNFGINKHIHIGGK